MIHLSDELSARIDAWIELHRSALVQDVCRLIRIPSVADETLAQPNAPFGPECRKVLDTYFDIAHEHGLATADREGYMGEAFVPEWQGKKKHLGLMGHLDVVPAGDGWIHPPFEPTILNGNIIGRGSQDNKGPCLATLYAVLCLRDLGIELENDVLAVAGVDEESGMNDAVYYAKQPNIPDLMLIMDSGFPVCFGERGVVSGELHAVRPFSEAVVRFDAGTASNIVPEYAEIVLKKSESLMQRLSALPKDCGWREENGCIVVWGKGIAGHLAFADGMRNAIGVLLNGLLEADLIENKSDRSLLAFAAKATSSLDGSTLSLCCEDAVSGKLKFGCCKAATTDGVLTLTFNGRCPVSVPCQDIVEKLSAALDGFTMEKPHILEPNYFPKETPVVQTLSRIFQQQTGLDWQPQVFAAGTHARKLPNAIAYGPGGLVENCHDVPKTLNLPKGHGEAHQPDEAQSIAALCKALKIYICAVLALDGQPLSKSDIAEG